MKYHIKNKNSKKEMKKVRMKPLPLMKNIHTHVCMICYTTGMEKKMKAHLCIGYPKVNLSNHKIIQVINDPQ